jgi:hypothetical protein
MYSEIYGTAVYFGICGTACSKTCGPAFYSGKVVNFEICGTQLYVLKYVVLDSDIFGTALYSEICGPTFYSEICGTALYSEILGTALNSEICNPAFFLL